MFEEYKAYLTSDFSLDYWSDEGIAIAGAILSKFSAADWGQLLAVWSTESSEWKIRCAETLDFDLPNEGAATLLLMLSDTDPEVIFAAVDSLRSWPMSSLPLTHAHIKHLTRVRERVGTLESIVLTRFLGDIDGH